MLLIKRFYFIIVACWSLLFSAAAFADSCSVPEGFVAVEQEKAWTRPTSKPVSLVNFWAVWCPPCLKELPMLDSIAGEPEFAVDTIHIGDNPTEIDQQFDQLKVKQLAKTIAPQLDTIQALGFQGLPATLIVVNGQIKYRYSGYIKHPPQRLKTWLSCLNQPQQTAPAAQQQTDIELGKALYLSVGKGGCVNCHGEDGNQPVMPFYPKIGGQTEAYLFNQMQDYRDKKRKNGLYMTMEVAMAPYNDSQIKQIAAYLASLSG